MFLRVPELVAINVNNTSSPFPAEQSFLINTNDVYVGFFINHILSSYKTRKINLSSKFTC